MMHSLSEFIESKNVAVYGEYCIHPFHPGRCKKIRKTRESQRAIHSFLKPVNFGRGSVFSIFEPLCKSKSVFLCHNNPN